MAIEIPHYSLPFRIEGTGAALVEQDTFAHIGDCAEHAAHCLQGDRVEAPEFGIPNELMVTGGFDLDAFRQALMNSEPRIAPVITSIFDPADVRSESIQILLEEES